MKIHFAKKEDASKFWSEERENGAVYNVYLKKVTYKSATDLEYEQSREFSHLMWETHKVRVIKSGTLSKLVESLVTVKGEMDSCYVNVFLATYRTFATPHQVLNLLIERYKILKSEDKEKTELHDVQLKTIKSVISVWLDTYPEDFREDPDYPCLQMLEKFAQECMEDRDLAFRAKHKEERFRKEAQQNRDIKVEFRFSICDEVDHMIDSEYHPPLDFFDISNQRFAEQLTCKDAFLFRKVIPHHCLGAVWARRDRKSGREPPTVLATIEQFNRVSLRVTATILKQSERKAARVRVITKWIEIAMELRDLKNFSSLKAIISGLQAHPVYRLRKTWAAVPKETLALFEELSELCSEENNQIASREILMKEATAKFPDLECSNKTLKKKNMLKRQSWIEKGIIQGTVPYLGTFLTDLTMMDTAMPDVTENIQINFEKKRKEFEVLAQIKLLQLAAQIYHFKDDTQFWLWFDAIRVYDENESHDLSCIIEPPTDEVKIKKKSASLGHKPSKWDTAKLPQFVCTHDDGLSVTSLSDSPVSVSTGPLVGLSCLNSDLEMRTPVKNEAIKYSACFPLVVSLLPTKVANGSPVPQNPAVAKISHSSSASSLLSSDSDVTSPYRFPDSCIIKVSVQTEESSGTHVYKSIMLSNTDHTHTVIKKSLEKYSIERCQEDFTLSQILPDKELLIPSKANVFYAMNNNNPNSDLNFVVRTKSCQEALSKKRKSRGKLKKLSL
ncbi:ral guanine nucleotide dissociation stimulator isoform X2 [Octopus sinensis]|uniref:Ral guanine nucleotide dissociation stimulator isoform X2 n=1 Tax=Octopus sinensis TaxID=2607531 RepID=A0A7E6FFA7_9MOLL|nr:ral guanine nucleotide dissociation stimulator isoform X2 [Octopus sinensis]